MGCISTSEPTAMLLEKPLDEDLPGDWFKKALIGFCNSACFIEFSGFSCLPELKGVSLAREDCLPLFTLSALNVN